MDNVIEKIYHSYKGLVYNYFYHTTLNPHVAEELTQDTFLRAFKYHNSFKENSSIKTWLLKIARNTYLSYIEKHPKIQDNIDDYELQYPIDDYKDLESRSLIEDTLSKLNQKDRVLIVLKYINEFSYQEIASIEGQVKVGIFRARQRFKELYPLKEKERF